MFTDYLYKCISAVHRDARYGLTTANDLVEAIVAAHIKSQRQPDHREKHDRALQHEPRLKSSLSKIYADPGDGYTVLNEDVITGYKTLVDTVHSHVNSIKGQERSITADSLTTEIEIEQLSAELRRWLDFERTRQVISNERPQPPSMMQRLRADRTNDD